MSDESRPWWLDRSGEDHRPPPARGRGARRAFGHTWWGRAWVDALEQRAGLDAGRLSRGRSYARRGAVASLQIVPGVAVASVQGTRAVPYMVTVAVPTFADADWERVLDVIGRQLGRTAALLDGELPPEVATDVADAGVDLLPAAGEVTPDCSCPDFATPCKHAAAVCYLVAEELDADPFALLRLRGRGRDDVLDALRARRRSPDAAEVGAESTDDSVRTSHGQGVRASEAFAADPGQLPDVPTPSLPPDRPGVPAAVWSEPPPEAGFDAAELQALATDTAVRAWQVATGTSDSGLGLDTDEDLARRAAQLAGSPGLAELADRSGNPVRELTGWGIAWRHGGRDGLSVLRETWQPGSDTGEDPDSVDPMAEAQAALATLTGRAGSPASVTVHANQATIGRWQLRLGSDGRWYPFVRSFGGWDLAGPPAPDADAAAAVLAEV